ASYRQCLTLDVKVLRGRNVTLGYYSDTFDTPDPYVKLLIKTAPNGKKQTTVKNNTANPIWDETFQFLLERELENILEITLMDSDVGYDDLVETQTFALRELELNKPLLKTFKFNKGSEVDVEMKVAVITAPTDMRYSVELCEEEKKFLQKREQFVFEAMKKLLGKDGPKTIDEVPKIAVVGSGGGFRAMVSLSGVFCALKDMGLLDCVMYTAGLSGSTWREPRIKILWHPRKVRVILNLKVGCSKSVEIAKTDHARLILSRPCFRSRKEIPTLSQQQQIVKDGTVPFPLYTCLHVKKDVSAQKFCEWVEFNPYEIGMVKYGTFMKTEHFGSKFFCGKLLNHYDEPSLHYMQGIWGSAFTILLQRVLHEGEAPQKTIKNMKNAGDLREELHGVINSDEVDPADEDESDEEHELDVTDAKSEEEPMEQEYEDHSFLKSMMESFVEKVSFLKSRAGRAGLVHNFLRGLQIMTAPIPSEPKEVTETADQLAVKAKRLFLVDSGLMMNSPYPLLLRPQREVDIYLSFDFSAREREDMTPFQELLLAEEWAKKNNIKFPPINANEQYNLYGLKEFYVFSDPSDPTCPVVIHFALANNKFKEQIRPGVPRKTTEEKDFGDFLIFEDPENWYSTFNFHYPPKPFDRLADLNEFNTLLGEQTIRDVIAECVRKRQKGKAMNGVNGH
ncbi:unnamed protein product, partial [Porites evermanni]